MWVARDGKDVEAGLNTSVKVDKGKKRKVDEGAPEAKPSKKRQMKASMNPTGVLEIDEPKVIKGKPREAGDGNSTLREQFKCLIAIANAITNNMAGLFNLQEVIVANSGQVADVLEAIINKSCGTGYWPPLLTQLQEEAGGGCEEAEEGDEASAKAEQSM
ncbi:hypothetical protein M404DRAFT_36272 [Pisolithus tinctorius Marx 270]|uniref:Uncharacterized protein n=1 Tax=Pisolithus tinctorius Marx 270 TaxID=870435 RepID=A0A0C3MWC1_PISTI|nr:hypothetical protein M404DRAFT_36272 [Pisolithus tinctorius Marx 270]